jgi:hypothetical protein
MEFLEEITLLMTPICFSHRREMEHSVRTVAVAEVSNL